jgi:hypothetical protein
LFDEKENSDFGPLPKLLNVIKQSFSNIKDNISLKRMILTYSVVAAVGSLIGYSYYKLVRETIDDDIQVHISQFKLEQTERMRDV